MGMDSTHLTLHSCALRGCKGPGVDLSDGAQAVIVGGAIADCVGGVWAWDSSQVKLHGAAVAGGPSHALLVDGTAVMEARVSGQWPAAKVAHAGCMPCACTCPCTCGWSPHATVYSALPNHACTPFPALLPLLPQECKVQGLVHATDTAWQGILHPSNT